MVTIPDDEKEAIPIVAPILTVNVSDNICPVFATPVRFVPSPTKLVAVTTPVWNAFPSGLKVIPDPTRVSLLNVAIPDTSKIWDLTNAVPRPVSAEPSPSNFVAVMTPV